MYSQDVETNAKNMEKMLTSGVIVRLSKSMMVSDMISAASAYVSQGSSISMPTMIRGFIQFNITVISSYSCTVVLFMLN